MKNVLITGASSGIGEAIANLASEHHWSIIVGYHSGHERAKTIADGITQKGGQAIPFQLNLEAPETLEEALSHLPNQIQGLDALVLCASTPLEFFPFTKATPEYFTQQLNINAVSSQVLIAQTWKLFFQKQHHGHVVGLLSQAMDLPRGANLTAYVAAKCTLASILESAALELGTKGLRVSAVSPHYTETPMLMHLHTHIIEAIRSKAPGGRFLTPREVAEVAISQLNKPPEPGHFLVERVRVNELHQ
jgi:NAD(P)-dependent dehydrogenase (short-subunit alcohol dehydrogenase family)